jgi:hypothetical protein
VESFQKSPDIAETLGFTPKIVVEKLASIIPLIEDRVAKSTMDPSAKDSILNNPRSIVESGLCLIQGQEHIILSSIERSGIDHTKSSESSLFDARTVTEQQTRASQLVAARQSKRRKRSHYESSVDGSSEDGLSEAEECSAYSAEEKETAMVLDPSDAQRPRFQNA